MKREAQPKQSDNKIEELLEEQRKKMAEEVKKAVQDKGAERQGIDQLMKFNFLKVLKTNEL